MHESWHNPVVFLRHVGRGACAICESVRPHVGCPPVVSGCHSGACGGTALRPHVTPELRLPSTTSRTSPPSPHGSIYSPLHYSPNPPRSSFDWKRRREEKVTAEAEESTAFAPVGGTRRTGAYSPECLQSEGNAPSHGHVPSLHFSPLLCGQCSARDSSRFRRIRDAPAFPPAAESCAGRFRWHCTVWPPPPRLSCRCGSACPQPHPGSALGLSRRFSIH